MTLGGYQLGAKLGAPVSLGDDELPPMCLASEDAAVPDAFVGYEGYYGVGTDDTSIEAQILGVSSDLPPDWDRIDASACVGGNPDLVVRLIHGDFLDPPKADMPAWTSEAFTRVLADAGYDVEFTLVEGAAHTGVGSPDSPAFEVIVDTALDVASG